MHLIDTHTHLYLPEFDPDRDEVVARSVRSGVEKMFMPNIDITSVEAMLSAEKRYPGICFPMIGLHPTSVKSDYESQLDRLEEISKEQNFIAIGEIGIDLYWDRTYINEQIFAFRRQIAFALEMDLPVVVHSREAFPDHGPRAHRRDRGGHDHRWALRQRASQIHARHSRLSPARPPLCFDVGGN
jgi:TatD DNase family protein